MNPVIIMLKRIVLFYSRNRPIRCAIKTLLNWLLAYSQPWRKMCKRKILYLCEDFIFPFFTTALVICQQIIIHLYIPFLAAGCHSFYRTSIVQSKTCNTHEPYGTSSSWNNNFLPKLNKLIMYKVHEFSLAKLSDNDRLQSISLSWHIQHI